MTDWFWKKLSMYVGWLAMIVLFILVIFAANIEIKDLDLWLHLASGRYIVENFQIPRTDIFSATVTGQPWINHEWLFQIVVYSVYSLGNIEGLITLQVMIVGITFLLLVFLGYNREKHAMMLVSLLLVVLVYQLRFFLRPDIFSLLFFVLFICVLSLMLQSRASVWIMFGLQVLWTNMHGFFILGPALVLLNIAAEFTKRRVYLPFEWNDVGRLTDEEYARLKQILVAVVLACFVNPYFVTGAMYPIKVLFSLGGDQQVFFGHIGELQRPFTLFSFFDPGNYLFYKLLILISVVSFLMNYRHIDIGILFFWFFFLVFSVLAVRNIPYFAFVAYFVILANTQHIYAHQFLAPHLDNDRFKSIASIAVKGFLIFAMLQYIQARALRGYYDFDTHTRKSEHGGMSLRNYPYKAVEFLLENNIRGKFFNDFNSGAYLIGRAYPQVKVFIDGRTELYGGDFFKNYKKILKGDTERFEKAVKRYNLSGVFLNSVYVPVPRRTIKYLYESPDWQLVYFDYDASIFLRDIPENQELIEELKIDLARREVPQADLTKLTSAKVTPYRYTNRAQALYNMGFYEQAKEEAEQALNISPTDAIAYRIKGKVALRNKEYMEALELLRHAKSIHAGDMETRFYLAKALYELEDYAAALGQLNRVLSAKPDNPLGLYLMSQIYQEMGKQEQADKYLEQTKAAAEGKMSLIEEEFKEQ